MCSMFIRLPKYQSNLLDSEDSFYLMFLLLHQDLPLLLLVVLHHLWYRIVLDLLLSSVCMQRVCMCIYLCVCISGVYFRIANAWCSNIKGKVEECQLQQAPWYAVIADKYTDVTTLEELSLFVTRYIEHGLPVEHFNVLIVCTNFSSYEACITKNLYTNWIINTISYVCDIKT